MKRDHLAAALLLVALAILLGARGAWGAVGLLPAVLGCWLALKAPARVLTPVGLGRVQTGGRGAVVATSPVTKPRGRNATVAPPGALTPLWRPATPATTRGAPPWARSAAPGGAGGQSRAAAPDPERHPYPRPPGWNPYLPAGQWLAAAHRIMARGAPRGALELEAAALEAPMELVPVEPLEGKPGWVIVQPGPRTPPRMVIPPEFEQDRPAWEASGLADVAADWEAVSLAADPDHCPVCRCRLFTADGPHCGACGWQSPEHRAALEADPDEALERVAETAEITAVHTSAEYAADLAAQDADAEDFIASRERAGFEWAAALARELEAERAGWNR